MRCDQKRLELIYSETLQLIEANPQNTRLT